ncbi:hypothetical protein NX059_012547 [Plenodomus lindquistii]|nr:hypothetical protein NX059_012547 [Plenodomus lindquistii]
MLHTPVCLVSSTHVAQTRLYPDWRMLAGMACPRTRMRGSQRPAPQQRVIDSSGPACIDSRHAFGIDRDIFLHGTLHKAYEPRLTSGDVVWCDEGIRAVGR